MCLPPGDISSAAYDADAATFRVDETPDRGVYRKSDGAATAVPWPQMYVAIYDGPESSIL